MLHGSGLTGTCENRGLSSAELKIGSKLLDPCELDFIRDRCDVPCLGTDLAGELGSDCGDLARRNAQAVICHPAGESEGSLDGVEPVHRCRIRLRLVALAFWLATVEKGNIRSLRIRAGKITIE